MGSYQTKIKIRKCFIIVKNTDWSFKFAAAQTQQKSKKVNSVFLEQ